MQARKTVYVLHTNKQTFFQYYTAKNIAEIYTELLQKNLPKIPRNFLPKIIPNENKQEAAIRKQLNLEIRKDKINLRKNWLRETF